MVAFLDSGETWTARHLTNADQHCSPEVGVVVSDLRWIDRKGLRPPAEGAIPAQLAANPARTLFARDVVTSISSVALRREVAARIGGFDVRFRLGESRDFLLRCALHDTRFAATHRPTCEATKEPADKSRLLLAAEQTVLFYEKHRDLAAVPAALRRRLLAASLVTLGRLLRDVDSARAARCFWRAWSLQPVHVQTLGQFALTGWRAGVPPPADHDAANAVGNETITHDP